MCLCACIHERKESVFITKLNLGCFCSFLAAILVYVRCTPIWQLHTKLYKVAWNVWANNSETVYHTDLRLGEVLYVLVFYIRLLSLNGFRFIFSWCDSENEIYVSGRCPDWLMILWWHWSFVTSKLCEDCKTWLVHFDPYFFSQMSIGLLLVLLVGLFIVCLSCYCRQ